MDKYINAAKDISEKINNSNIFNPKKKTLIISFCVAIIAITAISVAFVIGEAKTDKTTTVPQETSQEAYAINEKSEEMKINVLFALEDNDKLPLLGVMRINSEKNSLSVAFLDGETYCSFNNLSGTMREHYRQGGATQLVWAVGEYAGISIERYLIADNSSFKTLLENIGDMTVTLEHDVVCGHDAASLIIEEGVQVLVPEMMTKYFGYLCDNSPSYDEELISLMGFYGKKLFCEGQESTEDNFATVLSIFETDISALDYVNNKQVINALATEAVLSSITFAESVSLLKE